MITALLSLSAAFAADHEISLESNFIGVFDRHYDVFDEDRTIGGRGGRVGVAVQDHVAIVGSWHYSGEGATVSGGGPTFIAALRSHEIGLGAKLDVRATDGVSPYLLVEGIGLVGIASFDSDARERNNPSQTRVTGFAPGGAVLLGSDFKLRQGGLPFTVGAHVELGYEYTTAMQLGALGDLHLDGVVGRVGVGVRF